MSRSNHAVIHVLLLVARDMLGRVQRWIQCSFRIEPGERRGDRQRLGEADSSICITQGPDEKPIDNCSSPSTSATSLSPAGAKDICTPTNETQTSSDGSPVMSNTMTAKEAKVDVRSNSIHGDSKSEPKHHSEARAPHKKNSEMELARGEGDPEKEWEIEDILKERNGKCRIQWAGIDPSTRRRWKPSWVSLSPIHREDNK
jgi:hypothetical protein